jgi:hypothetical protein
MNMKGSANQKMNQILLLNDNAILHTSPCTREAAEIMGMPFCG